MKKKSNIIIKLSDEGIARIILNQPDSYNALSASMLKSLILNLRILNNKKKY